MCIPEEAPVSLTLPVAAGQPAPHPTRRGADRAGATGRALAEPVAGVVQGDAGGGHAQRGRARPRPRAHRRGVVLPRALGRHRARGAPAGRGSTRAASRSRSRGDSCPRRRRRRIDGVLVLTERLDGGTARQAFALRAAAGRSGDVRRGGPARGSGARARRRPGAEPDALRVAGPVDEGAGLVEPRGGVARGVRRHGLAYTAGVLASFGAVAGALLALRAGGRADRLGLSAPVAARSSRCWPTSSSRMALSLSGVLRVGGRLAGAGQALAARPGYAGSFFTGALATVAATPCTAPFMGAALGFALTQPLGDGARSSSRRSASAWPCRILLLTLVPAWRRLLPRPGRLDGAAKQFLAFPLYASVAWLVWVLSQQAGPTGVAAALGGPGPDRLRGLALSGLARRGATWRRAGAAAVAALALGAVALGPLAGARRRPPARRGGRRAGSRSAPGASPSCARRASRSSSTSPPPGASPAWSTSASRSGRRPWPRPSRARAWSYLKADWTNRDAGDHRRARRRSGATAFRSTCSIRPRARAGRRSEPAVLPQILSEGA